MLNIKIQKNTFSNKGSKTKLQSIIRKNINAQWYSHNQENYGKEKENKKELGRFEDKRCLKSHQR